MNQLARVILKVNNSAPDKEVSFQHIYDVVTDYFLYPKQDIIQLIDILFKNSREDIVSWAEMWSNE